MSEDRFELWLRQQAAGYNAPPDTPRQRIWHRIAALRSYNRPGATPRAAIWEQIEASRAYNRPPATPREAMWLRIDAARADARGAPTVVPLMAARSARLRSWTIRLSALAAMLLIGIGFGRFWFTGGEPAAVPGATRPAPALAGRDTTAADATSTLATTIEEHATGAERATAPGADAPIDSPSAGRESPRLAAAPDHEAATDEAAVATEGAAAGALYRVAAVRTFSRAEALLTSFRAGGTADSAGTGPADEQIAEWARDLLATTRLLLDSPAKEDPQALALLADLELVLVQLVQLGGGGATGAEQELIEDAVRDRNLLPRIRTVVPAGNVAIGTRGD
ncbi:MAG: hypothetical protein ACRELD_15625 [Longimicrobiales bacterium]